MAKKSKKRATETKSQSTEQALGHKAFAGLAGLQGVASAAPEAQSAPPVPQEAVEPEVPKRFPRKIVLRREKKGRSGKTVTRISGVPRVDLAGTAKQMKKALGCGASVEGEEILLLGSLVDRAAAWFEKAGAREIVKGN